MDILVQFLLLALGFVMLVKGADWFVEGSSGIADRFGIPQLVIGLTIVAMGTSAPEAAVSITAALQGTADITVGNVVGSNILNVLVILGLSSAITPIAVAKSTIRYEIPFTRYFYQYEAPRPSSELAAEIRDLEMDLAGVLDEIFGE